MKKKTIILSSINTIKKILRASNSRFFQKAITLPRLLGDVQGDLDLVLLADTMRLWERVLYLCRDFQKKLIKKVIPKNYIKELY